jgi:parallel beta-helix repeat protein
MNTSLRLPLHTSLFAFFSMFFVPCSLYPQGTLTPSGPPAPTMKTLDQVEARTPIAGGTSAVIIGSGSYYLTGNLNISAAPSGIDVVASNVTIDLNGFSVTGSGPGSGSGIFVNGGVSNVRIFNGTIRNWGGYGINGVGNSNLRVEKLQVIANGGPGIAVDVNGTVIDCVADSNTGTGIQGADNCVVKDCQAISTAGGGATGIALGAAAVVTGCVARGNSGDGIAPGPGSMVKNCTAFNNTVNGILVGDSCTVRDCIARSNSSNGIKAGNDCEIAQNNCSFNGLAGTDAGLWVTGSRNLITANKVSSNNSTGIRVTSTSNVIMRNVTMNNLFAFSVGSGNDAAPGGTVGASTNPWLNVID